MRRLDGIANSRGMILSKLQEMMKDRKPGELQSMVCQESDMTERLNNNRLFKKLHLFLAPHIASSVLISTVNQLLRC